MLKALGPLKGIVMQELIVTIIWVICGVVGMTLIYRIAPYREWRNKKPRLVFFPKYTVEYSGEVADLISNIKDMGFELKNGSTNIYARGKPYGDFSAKALKLHIEIAENDKRIKVYAPFLGVFFDTGDLWSITLNAVQTAKP